MDQQLRWQPESLFLPDLYRSARHLYGTHSDHVLHQ